MSWDDFQELFVVVEPMIVKSRVVSFLNFYYSDTTRLVANLSADDMTDHLNMSKWSDATDFPETSSRGQSKVGDKSGTSS